MGAIGYRNTIYEQQRIEAMGKQSLGLRNKTQLNMLMAWQDKQEETSGQVVEMPSCDSH